MGEYEEIAKQLYNDVKNETKDAKKNKKSDNDKGYIARTFQKALYTFFNSETVKQRLGIKEVTEKAILPLKEEFLRYKTSKKADLKLTLQNDTEIFIEIKRWLSFDFIGAAFFEAFCSKKVNFFVFSEHGYNDYNYTNWTEYKDVGDLIDGIIVVGEREQISITLLEKFFARLENYGKPKTTL